MSCFFKFYNSLQFTKVNCATRHHVLSRLSINSEFFSLLKITAPEEGRKPSREEYVVESELAILSILCKLIIIISPQDFSEGDKEAELINVFNCRYWQTEIAFARMLGNLLVQPCVYDSKFGELLWELLKVMHLNRFMIEIKKAFCFSVWDFRLNTQITGRFAVLAV